MESRVLSFFSKNNDKVIEKLVQNRKKQRVLDEMHKICESIVSSSMGAGQAMWNQHAEKNEQIRLAACLGAADEMVIAMFIHASPDVLVTIQNGCQDSISYLSQMRHSVRTNILEEKNKMLLRSQHIYEENIFGSNDMTSSIQAGKAFVQHEMLYRASDKTKSRHLNRRINQLMTGLKVQTNPPKSAIGMVN